MTCAPPSTSPTRTARRARSMARRVAYTINTNDQIKSADEYAQHRRRLPQRRAGAPADVATLVAERREHQARRLDEQHPGADPQRAAPAGRERRRRRQPHPALLPELKASLPAGRRCRRPDRPHDHDPRLDPRCRVRADARRRAGRAGDLPVPAQRPGHHHSEPVGAAVPDRHLRRHVPGRTSA